MNATDTAGRAELVPQGGGAAYHVIADLVQEKASAGATGGLYEVFEVTAPPGPGAPLHRHAIAETFHVLEGRFRFPRADGSAAEAGPGDVVVVPGGAVHTYENVGDGLGRFLVVAAPAGPPT